MSRLRQTGQRLGTLEAVGKAISLLSHEVDKQLSNGLTLDNNMDMVKFSVSDSGAADTSISIVPGLGRPVSGYIVTNRDKGGVVYSSGSNLGTITGTTLFCSVDNMAFEGYFF